MVSISPEGRMRCSSLNSKTFESENPFCIPYSMNDKIHPFTHPAPKQKPLYTNKQIPSPKPKALPHLLSIIKKLIHRFILTIFVLVHLLHIINIPLRIFLPFKLVYFLKFIDFIKISQRNTQLFHLLLSINVLKCRIQMSYFRSEERRVGKECR